MRTSVKWGLNLAAALLASLLVFAGLLIVVMNTTAGSQWAVHRLAALAPGDLVLDEMDGTLWRGLAAERVAYDDGERHVEIDALALRVNWTKLAAGVLELRRLDAEAIRVRMLSESGSAARRAALSPEPLPVHILILQSRIGSLSFTSGGNPVVLEDLVVGNASSDGRDIRVRTARVSITRVTASAADLRMTIGRHWPLSANVSWRLEDDTWSGNGRVWGSLEELRFDHRVAGPYPALASGSLQPMLPAGPQLDMLVNWERWNFGDQELVSGAGLGGQDVWVAKLEP